MSSMTLSMLLLLKDMASGPLGAFTSKLQATSHQLMAWGQASQQAGRVILSAMEKPIKVFSDAEDASIGLETTMMRANGAVEGSFSKINQLAIQLGNQLPGNTADFQNMFSVLLQNRVTASSILGGVGEATADLAVLLKQDFSTMAESVAQISKAAGVTGKDMLPFADTLQRIAHQGVSVTNMGFAFSKSAAMMQQFGIQGNKAASEFAPILTQLLQLGYSGETVGTNMSSLMMNLYSFERGATKQAKETQQSLKAMGIELDFFDNKTQNLRGPRQFIQELGKIKKLSKDKQASVISSIFGTGEDAKFAQILNNNGLKGYDQIVADAKKQASLQQRIAKTLTSLKNVFDAAVGTFENTMVSFIEPIAPELKKLADGFGKVAEQAGSLMKAHPTLTKFAAGATLVSGATLVAGGATLTGMGMVINAMGPAGTAVSFLSKQSYSLMSNGIKASTAMGKWNASTKLWAATHLQSAGAFISSQVKMATTPGLVSSKIAGMGVQTSLTMELMRKQAVKMGTGMRASLNAAPAAMKALVTSMPSRIGSAITSLPSTLGNITKAAGGGLSSALRAAAGGFRALGLAVLTNPLALAAVGIAAAALLIFKYWKPITGFFRGVWAGLKAGLGPLGAQFAKAFKPLAPLLNPVMNALKSVWNWLVNLLKPVDDVGGKAEGMGKKFGTALAGMVKKGAEMLAYFVGLPGQFVAIGSQLMQGLARGITSAAGAVMNTISSIAGKIKSAFTGLMGIHSPSRVFMGYGNMLGEGLRLGMLSQTRQLSQAAGSIAKAATPTFSASMPALAVASGGRRGSLGNGGTVFHFSPVIHVGQHAGSNAREEAAEGLRASYPEFVRMLERYQRDKKRSTARA